MQLSVMGLARFRATQDTNEIFEFANDAIAKLDQQFHFPLIFITLTNEGTSNKVFGELRA